MLLTILSVFTTTQIFANPADRQDWSRNDYWEETKLQFNSLIYGIFNDHNCKSSTQKFIACLAVLNKMQDLNSPKSEYHIGVDLDDGLKFIKIPKEDISLNNYLIQSKESIDKILTSQGLRLLRDSFLDELAKFEKDYLNSNNDSYTASQLYNTYLTIAEDPHSYIVPKNEMEDQSRSTQNNKGIGIFLESYNHNSLTKIIITEVIEKSPANLAGLLSGDIILSINDKNNFEEMYQELSKNDVLLLTLLREGRVINKSITKGHYSVKNVKSQLITRPNGSYGYIKLRSFSDSSACYTIKRKIDSFLLKPDFQGFILDLRNNGGGLVNQAQCILKIFLEPTSTVWMTREIDRKELVLRRYDISEYRERLQGHQNIVLINGYSASASEAVAMYLQDYEKAYIIGETSFGKGSMQSLYQDNNESYGSNSEQIIKAQTVALYYGPKGISPQIHGVAPDFQVFPKIDQTEDSPYLREKDQYAFPIPDRDVDIEKFITERRKENINLINNCLDKNDSIQSHYEKLSQKDKRTFDHQLEFGIQTIQCAKKETRVNRMINIPKTSDYPMMSLRQYQILRMREYRQQILEEEMQNTPVFEVP